MSKHVSRTLSLVICMLTILVLFDLLHYVFAKITYVEAQQTSSTAYVMWSPDGSKIAKGYENSVQIIDATNLTVLNTIDNLKLQVLATVWSPDSNRLAIYDFPNIVVWEYPWDANLSSTVAEFTNLTGVVSSIAFSPDSSKLAIALGETVQLGEINTSTITHRFLGAWSLVMGVLWNNDGRLAITTSDNITAVLNSTTGEVVNYFYTSYWTLTANTVIVFSSDGEKMAIADESGGIHIWGNTRTTEFLTETSELILNHGAGVNDLSWSSYGQLLASAGRDGNIKIWDIPNGNQVEIINVSANTEVSSVAWSPDGTLLAYGSANGDLVLIPNPLIVPSPTPSPSDTPVPPTDTPVPTALITNISVANGKTYVQDTMALGETLYIDRTYTFTSIPDEFLGQEFIRTANDDKALTTSNFLTFTLTQDAAVYVLFDSRFTAPSWLSSWTDTKITVVATEFNNTQLARRLYLKYFPAGSVTLDANNLPSNSVMYNVMAVPDTAAEQMLYRINAGGAQVSTNNKTFALDSYVTGGKGNTLASGDIANTTDDVLYYTEHSADVPNSSLQFTYDFPVANGTYNVRLHFAELWWTGVNASRPAGTGRRVFDVQIEGTTMLDDYDITASAGAALTADVKTFTNLTVSDGSLTIYFPPASVDYPSISAIEVFTTP